MTDARALLAEAVNLPDTALGQDPKLGVLAGWDSLAHMRLILTLEARLGRQLSPIEIVSIEGLSDIEALL